MRRARGGAGCPVATSAWLAALAAAGSAGALWWGAARWRRGTRELRQRLEHQRLEHQLLEAARPGLDANEGVDRQELAALPAPVARYLRRVLGDGVRRPIATVRIRHAGRFDMGRNTARWCAFTSDQQVITRPPGFDWDARIRVLPGVSVSVHDAFVDGEGVLQASLFGLVPLASSRGGGELARGELMRFLAEAAWYPTALLPSQGVSWEAVDDRSARGTLTDGAVTAALLFEFGEDGLLESVRAEDRGRGVGRDIVPTPWQGRFWRYEERAGFLVPLEGEVAWLLPDGPRPYWRGRIEQLEYELG